MASGDCIPVVEPASVRESLDHSLVRGHLDHLGLENTCPTSHLFIVPFAKASGLPAFNEDGLLTPGKK